MVGDGIEFVDERPIGSGVGAELVEEAPEADGGVVKVLLDELAELLLCGGVESGGVADAVDEAGFCPDDDAGAVAEGVFVVGVLVVCEADGVGADFFDEGVAGVDVGGCDGPALVEEVLVDGDAVEGIGMAVEEEAVLGVYAEGSQAEGLDDTVEDCSVLDDVDGGLVEVGIGEAVPEVGGRDGESLRDVGGGAMGDGLGDLGGADFMMGGVCDGAADVDGGVGLGIVLEEG